MARPIPTATRRRARRWIASRRATRFAGSGSQNTPYNATAPTASKQYCMTCGCGVRIPRPTRSANTGYAHSRPRIAYSATIAIRGKSALTYIFPSWPGERIRCERSAEHVREPPEQRAVESESQDAQEEVREPPCQELVNDKRPRDRDIAAEEDAEQRRRIEHVAVLRRRDVRQAAVEVGIPLRDVARRQPPVRAEHPHGVGTDILVARRRHQKSAAERGIREQQRHRRTHRRGDPHGVLRLRRGAGGWHRSRRPCSLSSRTVRHGAQSGVGRNAR